MGTTVGGQYEAAEHNVYVCIRDDGMELSDAFQIYRTQNILQLHFFYVFAGSSRIGNQAIEKNNTPVRN